MNGTATSRRSFLSAGAAAATTVGVPATAAWAQDSADDVLEALWLRWRALSAESNRFSRSYDEATARLPWWAASGPAYLPDNGTENGWPAVQGVEPDENSMIRKLIRPGLSDIKKLLGHETSHCGERGARARYRDRVRALVKRPGLTFAVNLRAMLMSYWPTPSARTARRGLGARISRPPPNGPGDLRFEI